MEDKKGENLLLKWDELKKRKCNRDIKKEQVLQKEDSCFNHNQDQKLETGENLLVRWDELKNRSNDVPPQSSLQKDAMSLKMTPNLEECNREVKKEQVLSQVQEGPPFHVCHMRGYPISGEGYPISGPGGFPISCLSGEGGTLCQVRGVSYLRSGRVPHFMSVM